MSLIEFIIALFCFYLATTFIIILFVVVHGAIAYGSFNAYFKENYEVKEALNEIWHCFTWPKLVLDMFLYVFKS